MDLENVVTVVVNKDRDEYVTEIHFHTVSDGNFNLMYLIF